MKQGDAVKLVIAVVILVLAGVLIAWNFGLFSGSGATPLPAGETAPRAPGQPRTAPGTPAPKAAPSSMLPVAHPHLA